MWSFLLSLPLRLYIFPWRSGICVPLNLLDLTISLLSSLFSGWYLYNQHTLSIIPLYFSSILNILNSNVLAHRDALEEVTFDESIIKKIDDILSLISLSRSVIYAHREDAEINPKFQIVFGYNIAKNQLLGTDLLTIDRSITDPLIKELDSLASQFKFFKDLSTLNKMLLKVL